MDITSFTLLPPHRFFTSIPLSRTGLLRYGVDAPATKFSQLEKPIKSTTVVTGILAALSVRLQSTYSLRVFDGASEASVVATAKHDPTSRWTTKTNQTSTVAALVVCT
mmetsp:Transcript_23194/g.33240  ORF Transcript_23194/g.33240 Transcript_23194/m.33240 type:complete len:108 (-) Transcript_23194:439-762(-)